MKVPDEAWESWNEANC